MKKRWPFPGEAPVTRARKVALAYRNLARELYEALRALNEGAQRQQRAAAALREALEKADARLLSYDSPATLEAIKTALKELDGGEKIKDLPPEDPILDLDNRFNSWGESFHAEQPDHYEMDDWVKASVAARLIHISDKTVNTLRVEGRIKGIWDKDVGSSGGYLYKVEDVYALSLTLRSRTWQKKGSIDNLNDSETGDPKCENKGTRANTGRRNSGTPPTTPSKTGSTTKPPSRPRSSTNTSPKATPGPGSD